MASASHPNHHSAKTLTYPINNQTAVRVDETSYPKLLEIAPLQKGLILLFNKSLIVEEGIGFGVPVVKYINSTYFSSSASCSIEKINNHYLITKTFLLDTIARKRVRETFYINSNLYRAVRKAFELHYLSKKNLRIGFNLLMQLRQLIGIRTAFLKVRSKGKVTVQYELNKKTIRINVNLDDLEKVGKKEIIILNEQGASFFNKYLDSAGLKLFEEEIGAWEKVAAAQASLSDSTENLKFTLTQRNHATLFRGREKIKNRFSWSGLSYSLEPEILEFQYSIEVIEK